MKINIINSLSRLTNYIKFKDRKQEGYFETYDPVNDIVNTIPKIFYQDISNFGAITGIKRIGKKEPRNSWHFGLIYLYLILKTYLLNMKEKIGKERMFGMAAFLLWSQLLVIQENFEVIRVTLLHRFF